LLITIGLPNAFGKDLIKLSLGFSTHDVRNKYILDILSNALELSKDKFGEFEIQIQDVSIPNQREAFIIAQGEFLNVAMALTTAEWEKNTIPIYIPLRRGLLNYRLLAINKVDLEKFNNITNLEQLKKLYAGLRRDWATRKVLNHLKFNIVDTYSYDTLFEMLSKGRFDYTVRGIYEINDEIKSRKDKFDNIIVAPTLALYIPAPVYFFVSPKFPQIAKRLQFGLERMVENGVLEDIFNETYFHYVKEADLKSRTIINIGNPLLSEKTPFERKELWFDFGTLTK
jgi:ABC-type amino acid transport substrate-binding protein